MSIRTIVGNIVDITGDSFGEAKFSVLPESYVFGSNTSTVVFGDLKTVVADSNGDVEFELHEGRYIGRISTTQGIKTFRLVVDSEGPWTLGRLIGPLDAANIPPLISAAFDAADRAESAATVSEDAADRAESAAAGVEFPVSYEPQSLNAGQQTQARDNIGAVFASPVADKTITVGSGGDFATLMGAINQARQARLLGRVTFNLLSGFVIDEQILLDEGNFAGWDITSEDAEVVVNRAALVETRHSREPAFYAGPGVMGPRLLLRLNMNSTGPGDRRDMIFAFGGHWHFPPASSGTYGILNAGGRGISCGAGGFVNIDRGIIDGSGEHNILAYELGTVNADKTQCTNAGDVAFNATRGGTIYGGADGWTDANMRLLSSIGDSAIRTRTGGRVIAPDRVVTQGGPEDVIRCEGGEIIVDNSEIQNAPRYAVACIGGSSKSEISANFCDLSNAGSRAIEANEGRVWARDAIATGAGINGCRAFNGEITARNADFRKSPGVDNTTPDEEDIQVFHGGIVRNRSGLGGANVAFNQFDPSNPDRGFVFR